MTKAELTLEKYLSKGKRVILFKEDNDDGYGIIPEFAPHISAFGDTPEEALKEFKIMITLFEDGELEGQENLYDQS